MNNMDLLHDIQRIKDIKDDLKPSNIAISKAFDDELDYPYAIDVEDFSFFYPNKDDRDRDFIKLLEVLK